MGKYRAWCLSKTPMTLTIILLFTSSSLFLTSPHLLSSLIPSNSTSSLLLSQHPLKTQHQPLSCNLIIPPHFHFILILIFHLHLTLLFIISSSCLSFPYPHSPLRLPSSSCHRPSSASVHSHSHSHLHLILLFIISSSCLSSPYPYSPFRFMLGILFLSSPLSSSPHPHLQPPLHHFIFMPIFPLSLLSFSLYARHPLLVIATHILASS